MTKMNEGIIKAKYVKPTVFNYLDYEKALQEIERLQAELAEVEKPKWISVSERLPECECLATGFQSEMIIGYIRDNEESETGYIAENECEILYDVTHWMPLPEPPEEGESR